MDRTCNNCGGQLQERYGSPVREPIGEGRIGECETCGYLQLVAGQ